MKSSWQEAIDAVEIGQYTYFGENVFDEQWRVVSVSIFRVVAKKSGGKKAERQILRIRAVKEKREQLFACAEYVCQRLNSDDLTHVSDWDRAKLFRKLYIKQFGKLT